MGNLTLFAALAAGIASFLSPCVLPLIPVYVASLAGTAADGSPSVTSIRSTLPQAIAFVFGFSAVFIALGALAGYLGRIGIDYVGVMRKVGGGLLILLGVQASGLIPIPLLYREVRADIRVESRRGIMRSGLMGLAFALGWTPCVGAVLGGILALAFGSQTVWQGVRLLSVYSLGLGLPFLAVSLALAPASRYLRAINRHMRIVSIASGCILIALGILMISGELVRITGWLSRI